MGISAWVDEGPRIGVNRMPDIDNEELPTLHAERVELADGRYLIYYTFDKSEDSDDKE